MAVLSVPSVRKDCQSCPIRFRAVCSLCDRDEMLYLEKIKYYRSFQAGQPVIWSGDKMDFVASVVTGVATLSQTMEDGRRQMVGLLLPSDFVGRPGRTQASYDVTATTDLVMCCFRRKPFEDLLLSTPHVSQRLLEMTLDELDAAREWLLLLGRKTALEKIASLLVIIARRGAAIGTGVEDGRVVFDLPLTREQMGDYLGLTLETVSRKLSALKAGSLIALEGNRRVTVFDLRALTIVSGEDGDAELADPRVNNGSQAMTCKVV